MAWSPFTFAIVRRWHFKSTQSVFLLLVYSITSFFADLVLIFPSINEKYIVLNSFKETSLVAQMVSFCLQCRRPRFDPWVGKISWRRKWQPTPVFLPGESQGQRSLVGYSPWGRKASDTTERLHFTSNSFKGSILLLCASPGGSTIPKVLLT